jgi:hypothetical protein
MGRATWQKKCLQIFPQRERVVQTPQEKGERTAVFQESQAQATRPPWPTHPPHVRTRSTPSRCPVHSLARPADDRSGASLASLVHGAARARHKISSVLGKWDAACCLPCTRVCRTPSLPICLAPVSSPFSHAPSNERGVCALLLRPTHLRD